jgi:hypothetical protein
MCLPHSGNYNGETVQAIPANGNFGTGYDWKVS